MVTVNNAGYQDDEIKKLIELANLYTQAKSLILYAEEVDPESRSNIQIIKELRDAFDHLMRVISAKHGASPPQEVTENYCANNLKKAIGHVYRAAFDALDGTVLSLREKTVELLSNYPTDVITEVIPEYWSYKAELEDLTNKVASHRERRDVGNDIGKTLDRYVEDVESIKKIYKSLYKYGPSLDECLKHHKNKNLVKNYLTPIVVGVILLLIGYLINEYTDGDNNLNKSSTENNYNSSEILMISIYSNNFTFII